MPGGRPLGAASRRRQEITVRAIGDGKTPLEYMIEVMRDESADELRRDDMAKAAAGYVHPRLAQIETHNETEVSVISAEPMSPDAWAAQHGAVQTNGDASKGTVQ